MAASLKKGPLLKRFRHTVKEMGQRCDSLDSKLEQFETLTRAVCAKLATLSKRKMRQLPASTASFLDHWWRWWLLLKDEMLGLHNGELRHEEAAAAVAGGGANATSFLYRNNFDMKPERYYKGSKKQYSGEALDDLRDALRLL